VCIDISDEKIITGFMIMVQGTYTIT
jgi:hypothetical protein